MKPSSRKRFVLHTVALLLLLALPVLFSACGSNEHMYRHNRSHCDCPTF